MENWKKNTILFLSGQAISLFGSMLVQYAIMWHITIKTQSATTMSFFIIFGILPIFFISPFGGVWADKFNKKIVINISDSITALASLIVAFFFMFGFDSISLLLFCSTIRALGQGAQMPAVSSFIPEIVPQKHLTRVNGINGSIQSFAMIASPMASGVLMTFLPLSAVFFIDVITAAIGIFILAFFVKIAPKSLDAKQDKSNDKSKGVNYFNDLKEGIRYIKNHGFILRLICISIIFFIAISPSAFLTPLQAARNFGAQVWRLTVIEVAFSGGMMLGGLLIGIWGGLKNKVYSMALACALIGIEVIALGLVNNFVIYTIIMALAGLTVPFYSAPTTAMLQSKVEINYMGRVFSVFSMASSLMMPAGMLIFGPLGDIVSIDSLLIATGAITACLSIPFISSKIIREAGKENI